MKILVLGHKGLLGNCVDKYLSQIENLEVVTTDKRWPNPDFIDFVSKGKYDWIVNCIALIPQTKPSASDLFSTNLGLPVFLASVGPNIIHASTNDLREDDEYALSKLCAENILKNFNNTFIIRSSIIGIETNNHKSFLSWFLTYKSESVNGFTNHYWNGITTLEWSKLAVDIINRQKNEKIIIPSTDTITKYELLILFKDIFEKNIQINPVKNKIGFNENTGTNIYLGSIESQLVNLKEFYSK